MSPKSQNIRYLVVCLLTFSAFDLLLAGCLFAIQDMKCLDESIQPIFSRSIPKCIGL